MAFKITMATDILNKILRNTNWTHAVNVFVSIHTGDPGETGATEFSDYDGNRPGAVVFDDPTAGGSAKVTQNAAATDLDFVNFGSAVTIAFIGIFDAATIGNFLWGGPVTPTRAVAAGDTFRLPGATGIVATLT